jgi:hypothetical protein
MTKSLLNLIALIVFTQTKILDHFEEYQRENSDYRDQYLFRQYLTLKNCNENLTRTVGVINLSQFLRTTLTILS